MFCEELYQNSGTYELLRSDVPVLCKGVCEEAFKSLIEAEQFCLVVGVLDHRTQPRATNCIKVKLLVRQMVLPNSLRAQVLQACRDDLGIPGIFSNEVSISIRLEEHVYRCIKVGLHFLLRNLSMQTTDSTKETVGLFCYKVHR